MEKNAFIEINNYTAKLIIADVQTNAFFNVVYRRVVPIELGKDFDKDRFLKRAQIDYTIDVLKQFKKACNMFEVTKTEVIATFLNEKKPGFDMPEDFIGDGGEGMFVFEKIML